MIFENTLYFFLPSFHTNILALSVSFQYTVFSSTITVFTWYRYLTTSEATPALIKVNGCLTINISGRLASNLSTLFSSFRREFNSYSSLFLIYIAVKHIQKHIQYIPPISFISFPSFLLASFSILKVFFFFFIYFFNSIWK